MNHGTAKYLPLPFPFWAWTGTLLQNLRKTKLLTGTFAPKPKENQAFAQDLARDFCPGPCSKTLAFRFDTSVCIILLETCRLGSFALKCSLEDLCLGPFALFVSLGTLTWTLLRRTYCLRLGRFSKQLFHGASLMGSETGETGLVFGWGNLLASTGGNAEDMTHPLFLSENEQESFKVNLDHLVFASGYYHTR